MGKSFADSVARFSKAGMAFVVNRKYDSPELRDALGDIELFLSRGKVLKDSRSTKAVLVSVAGLEVFLKRYNSRSLGYCIKNSFREAKAFRSFRHALEYLARGIETPEPVAAVSRRERGILRNSYLLSIAVPDAVPTLDFFRIASGNESVRDKYISGMAGILSRMHSQGICHRDAKLSNFYVSSQNPSSGEFSLGIWDLDGSRIVAGPIGKSAMRKDLARLALSWIEISGRLGLEPDPLEIAGKIVSAYGKNWGGGARLGDFKIEAVELIPGKQWQESK